MEWLAALSAALPVIGKVIDVFQKTPDEKLHDVKNDIIKHMEDVSAALAHMEKNKGDTSELEKIFNRRR